MVEERDHQPQDVERNELMDGDATDIGERAKSVPWYHPEIKVIPDATREILEQYSKVPRGEVETHIKAFRDKAWQIHPYPCIGQFRFLDVIAEQMDVYPELLRRLKSGGRLLDLGCNCGQEVRKLVFDGVPSENLFGADIEGDFWRLGYELFRDRNTLKTRFIQADIFESQSGLQELIGGVDVVYAMSFFHLFGYERQVQASKEVVKLLKPQKGSMILGRQIASVSPGEREHRTNPGGKMYRHNTESFKDMWEQIGRELGVKFSVAAQLLPMDEGFESFHKQDTRRLWFVVRRE